MENTKKSYEISFLLRDEGGISVLVKHLSRFEAEITDEGEVKEIKLSYPINKLQSAYSGCIHFDMLPASVAELTATLKLESVIIRFLVVTPPFAKSRSQRGAATPLGPERQSASAKVKPAIEPEAEISNDALEAKLEEILNK